MWHLAGNDKGIIEIKDAMNEGSYPHCVWDKKWKASEMVSSDIIEREKQQQKKKPELEGKTSQRAESLVSKLPGLDILRMLL